MLCNITAFTRNLQLVNHSVCLVSLEDHWHLIQCSTSKRIILLKPPLTSSKMSGRKRDVLGVSPSSTVLQSAQLTPGPPQVHVSFAGICSTPLMLVFSIILMVNPDFKAGRVVPADRSVFLWPSSVEVLVDRTARGSICGRSSSICHFSSLKVWLTSSRSSGRSGESAFHPSGFALVMEGRFSWPPLASRGG